MSWRHKLGVGEHPNFAFAAAEPGVAQGVSGVTWARSPLVSEVSVLKETVVSVSDRHKTLASTTAELVTTVGGLSKETDRLQNCFRALADLVDAEIAGLATDGTRLTREVAALKETVESAASSHVEKAMQASQLALDASREVSSDLESVRSEMKLWREAELRERSRVASQIAELQTLLREQAEATAAQERENKQLRREQERWIAKVSSIDDLERQLKDGLETMKREQARVVEQTTATKDSFARLLEAQTAQLGARLERQAREAADEAEVSRAAHQSLMDRLSAAEAQLRSSEQAQRQLELVQRRRERDEHEAEIAAAANYERRGSVTRRLSVHREGSCCSSLRTPTAPGGATLGRPASAGNVGTRVLGAELGSSTATRGKSDSKGEHSPEAAGDGDTRSRSKHGVS